MAKVQISGHMKEINPEPRKPLSGRGGDSMLAKYMPGLVRHAGLWEGQHYHIDMDGNTVGMHKSVAECVFPAEGYADYIHRETIIRRNGRRVVDVANGIFQGDKLWMNNEKFEGSAQELKTGIILFELTYRGDLSRSLKEMLSLSDSGDLRSRTIQWFEDGRLVKRSLCNEKRINRQAEGENL